MSRSVVPILSVAIIALFLSASCAMAADPVQTPSDMLESALPAVVTIGVFAVQDESTMYGFSGSRAVA